MKKILLYCHIMLSFCYNANAVKKAAYAAFFLFNSKNQWFVIF